MSSSSTFPTTQSTSTPGIANPSQPPFMSNQPLTPLFQVARESEAHVKQWTTSIPSGPSFSSSSSSYSYPSAPIYHPDFPPFLSFAPNPSPGYQSALRSLASSSASASNQNQPVSYPLRQGLSKALDPVVLLQLLNPGFDIHNEDHRREVNAWLGFSPDHKMTPDDIEVIQRKVMYADLRPEQQREARRAFYEGLRPLLKGGQPIELPFKDSYGHTILVELVKDVRKQQLAIEFFFYTEGSGSNSHRFSIYENGESTYALCAGSSVKAPIIGVIDITSDQIIHKSSSFGENIKKDYKKHSNACFNLMMQNYEKIHSILSQDPSEKNKRAVHLFNTCVSLLNTLAAKQHPIQRLQDPKKKLNAQEGTITTTYGPFWNPVTNASDSFFNWKIQELGSGGISFSSEKQSGGRGFHSMSERSVTLSTTRNPNELKVTVTRGNSFDISGWQTSSEYLCGFNPQGQVVIRGLNKESTSECLLEGIPDIRTSNSSMPTVNDQQADAKFVAEVLENIGEIASSPHTVLAVFDLEEPRRTLQGRVIPPERFAHFAKRSENSYGGIPYQLKDQSWYDVENHYYSKQE